MLLQVVHETTYDYAPAVKTAQHLAHLKPRQTPHQKVLRHRLSVTPQPAQLREVPDAWGNTRTFFSLASSHERLRVVADSLVDTAPPPEPASTIPWEDARERMRYHRDARFDPASEFAFASPYVPRHEDFMAYAQPSFTPGRPLLAAARELMARIHREFEYHSQATDASTPALQSLALRQGVCQDFAHVMIGCLRSLGLPARYVSGYLLTEPPPGQPRLVGADASHAWASVWLPGEGGEPGTWADLDPTNDRAPGEDYVVLAIGRDYADVSPVRGVIHGGANHQLKVAVTVAPA
ncbi:transglutaminase family protein [Ramlibacter sp. MAHUQ-53]|uniref:transglutaminase family protein n=1 Tax=unclassified Ramlibacter TaxID=2617605 RepID=UPI003638B766